jgi:hypothetical protein
MTPEKTDPKKPDSEKKKSAVDKEEKKKGKKTEVVCTSEHACVKIYDRGDVNKERVRARYSGTGKRCPFLFLAGDDFVAHCIGEYCMFWNDGAADCNINVIATGIAAEK